MGANNLQKGVDNICAVWYYNYIKRKAFRKAVDDMITVKTLLQLNNTWDYDTQLTFVSNDNVPFITLDFDTLNDFYPRILNSGVRYFENNTIYLK